MMKDQKEILQLLKHRRSCRSFKDEEIPEDIMKKLLEAAVCAPSSGGFQNYSIIKVADREKKTELRKLCRNQCFIERAPMDLIFCIDLHREKRISESFYGVPNLQYEYETFLMWVIDISVAAQNLCIAAEAEGLGSVYVGNILNCQDKVVELLGLPELVLPVVMVSLGYPKNEGFLSGKYGTS